MPLASTILMIRPAAFGFNKETEEDNFFQCNTTISKQELQQKAEAEFDNMVKTLRGHGIDVMVIEDTKEPAKPDAIFPNNWLSTSPEGIVSVFSMFAPNRRTEKREDILKRLGEQFIVKDIQNLSEFENEGRFLEGTGSMVIDHDNKMIYASISERTNMPVLEKFIAANGYQAIVFIATDKNGRHIYHTNIMMSIGENFSVLCEEAIDEEWELIAVRQLLESTGHTIIAITREQMHCFAGNVLQLRNDKGDKFLILSTTALNSLRKEQKQMVEAYAQLVPIEVSTIEEVGGGGVRCMMAEIFLEKRNRV